MFRGFKEIFMNNTGKKFGGRKKNTPNKKTKLNFKENQLPNYVKKTGLYIINTHKYYKIGISNNLYQRISMLNTMNPYGINIINIIEISSPIEIEKQLHKYLCKKLYNGREWFELNNEDVILLKSMNINNINEILSKIRYINGFLF